jgi:hypothetical protein
VSLSYHSSFTEFINNLAFQLKANVTPESIEKLARQSMRIYGAEYEREKWMAAASRHSGATGECIGADQAKATFGGKWKPSCMSSR